jgi:ABC-type transport system substrate-binding protein
MRKRTIWAIICGCMVLSMVVTACGTATTSTKTTQTTQSSLTTQTTQSSLTTQTTQANTNTPVTTSSAAEKPKYGGKLFLSLDVNPTYMDPARNITGSIVNLTSQQLMEGDWAKGPAGGYGTNETDWAFGDNDLYYLKGPYIAESVKWTIDSTKNEGTIVYTIGKGRHWSLNPKSEASRLVNGREITTDDVIGSLNRATKETWGYIYPLNPELRTANITKTGQWEISVRLPLDAVFTGINRFNDSIFIAPNEVYTKYGSMELWQNNVSSGPFMISDYIPGSSATLNRNQNYYMKNPVGPGKGDQLPYIDSVNIFIIPDYSTRLAALRTGKVDWTGSAPPAGIYPEDAKALLKLHPEMKDKLGTSWQGRGTPMFMRTDNKPFNDIKVRKAMMMAVDFNTILKNYWGGVGQINTFPYSKVNPYEELYLDFNDPDFPAEAKALYQYNPDQAKALLKEAGYPNGFKSELLILSNEIDYYSIVKDMLAKVNVELSFTVVDSAQKTNMQLNWKHPANTTATTGPVAQFFTGMQISGPSRYNMSCVDDPKINSEMTKIRLTCLSDLHEAMKQYRELTKYVVAQAYTVPNVLGPNNVMWWPWVKNYSGEICIGYDNPTWAAFIWLDRDLKKSMGFQAD